MPGSTTRGYPYPLGPEQALGSADIQGLAEAVDTDVTALIPAGTIWAWAGDAAPPGWQLCNGTLLVRSSFPRLFATIGTKYGEGDGVSTFATPNLEGRVIVAAGGGYALNATGGAATHTLTVAEMPSHNHSTSQPGGGSSGASHNYAEIAGGGGVTLVNPTAGATSIIYGNYIMETGGGAAHNNMQPYLVLNYIIKL